MVGGSAACAIEARVAACAPICREHVRIELVTGDFPPSEPGQFVQLQCRDADDARCAVHDWPEGHFPSLCDKDLRAERAFLRRPFSIADRVDGPGGDARLTVISRAVGVGTRWLEGLRAGDILNLTGPLGHGFEIAGDGGDVVLAGGGVGIPPLLYLARRLHESGWTNVVAFFGARSREVLPVRLQSEPDAEGRPTPCVFWPGDAPYPVAIASDDGSIGWRGLVTDALRRWSRGRAARRVQVLACGPEGMLQAVAAATRALGWACQLCIERNMGCGLGTCLSCVVRVRAADRPQGWRWALTCQDGPVFCRDDLLDRAPGGCA